MNVSKLFLTAALGCCLLFGSQRQVSAAVDFQLATSGNGWTFNSPGFGDDGFNETTGSNPVQQGTLLEINTTTSGNLTSGYAFDLEEGETELFAFGTVQLAPDEYNGRIRTQETDNLNGVATLVFVLPTNESITLNIFGQATAGPTNDNNDAAELSFVFDTESVFFGNGGQYSVTILPFAINTNNSSNPIGNATASVTLVTAPETQQVPEPATIAIWGGLLAVGLVVTRMRGSK